MNTIIARIKLNLTQKQLAEKVGISQSTMVRIEKNEIDSIRLGTLKKVAKVLNSSVEELFFTQSH